MASITEDYVSFETAKLLKEKGFGEKFDEFCPYSYSIFLPNSPRFGQTDLKKGSMKHQIYAPTLQRTMKWLRKVHNIDIWPERHNKRYKGNIHSEQRGDEALFYEDSPEEACEAAIKYCLENLI